MEFFTVFFKFIGDLFETMAGLKIGSVSYTNILIAFLIVSMVVYFFWRGARA